MKLLSEKDKQQIASEYVRREKRIKAINQKVKNIVLTSIAVILPSTIALTAFIGPIGLLSLGLGLIPIIEIDYETRQLNYEYEFCAGSVMTIRELKKKIKNGELQKYIEEIKINCKKEKEFSEIYNFKVENEFSSIQDVPAHVSEKSVGKIK